MKKHRYFLFAACAALAGCGLFLWMSSAVNRPFAHLNSADLASVTVRLSPPDKTLLITEPGQLVEYLKDTVIYQRDDSYQDYCGQAVTFSLTMADGSQTSVMEITTLITLMRRSARLKVGRGVCEKSLFMWFLPGKHQDVRVNPNPAVCQNVQINGEADPVVIDDQAKRATN